MAGMDPSSGIPGRVRDAFPETAGVMVRHPARDRRTAMHRAIRGRVAAAAAALTALVPAWAAAAPGVVDSDFGVAGQVTMDNHVGARMLVLPSDLVVVAGGTATDPSAVDVWQFRTNGTPNASFGTGGRIRLAPTAAYEDVDLARDPGTGQLYVRAFVDDATSTTRVWRLTAQGDLDTTWEVAASRPSRRPRPPRWPCSRPRTASCWPSATGCVDSRPPGRSTAGSASAAPPCWP
ncbi:MAG: hypothetical protein R2734_15640 [Nocardioides sp.]